MIRIGVAVHPRVQNIRQATHPHDGMADPAHQPLRISRKDIARGRDGGGGDVAGKEKSDLHGRAILCHMKTVKAWE
ncbi:hypothetical protein GHA01_06140 [Novacetimonas hansenii]|uniref:Uncharacterized protein n=2 Tax=Novacetimonas hansenii TaxID=436 RepID=A0ABQ0SC31_NOVHA|nr:hypothetical protein GXY_13443 [Novacetimonas hansenii ATCC 23769]GAN84354.1 hypothetical protein Gaha_0157_010 [Novacetimonas hansenii JCM 7643]GEC62765.1 hypothetical protein GHA01_06140 [Novacetimonas hansenii]